jgi:hypothetical protein
MPRGSVIEYVGPRGKVFRLKYRDASGGIGGGSSSRARSPESPRRSPTIGPAACS